MVLKFERQKYIFSAHWPKTVFGQRNYSLKFAGCFILSAKAFASWMKVFE
jgi:hypothetical protein